MLRKLLLLLFTLLPFAGRADDDSLRLTLEKLYNDWRSALLAKSVEAWQRSTSAYRQMCTRNAMISQGKGYPEALFDLPIKPPSLLDLRLVEVEAVGDTAHLIYFGRVDLGVDAGGAEIPENLLMLKYYREQGAWKFDTNKYINLAGNPDMRDALRKGNADFLKHPPFNPPGNAPAVPKPCGKPEKVGALRIHAIGYEVIASLNGYDYPPVADDADQQLIIGGLARGGNKLGLAIKQLPISDEPGATRHLEIQAVISDAPDKPMTRVFRWEPKTHPAAAHVELNIVLDTQTLRGI